MNIWKDFYSVEPRGHFNDCQTAGCKSSPCLDGVGRKNVRQLRTWLCPIRIAGESYLATVQKVGRNYGLKILGADSKNWQINATLRYSWTAAEYVNADTPVLQWSLWKHSL